MPKRKMKESQVESGTKYRFTTFALVIVCSSPPPLPPHTFALISCLKRSFTLSQVLATTSSLNLASVCVCVRGTRASLLARFHIHNVWAFIIINENLNILHAQRWQRDEDVERCKMAYRQVLFGEAGSSVKWRRNNVRKIKVSLPSMIHWSAKQGGMCHWAKESEEKLEFFEKIKKYKDDDFVRIRMVSKCSCFFSQLLSRSHQYGR